MLERLLVLLGVSLAVVLIVVAVRAWSRARTRRLLRAPANGVWRGLGVAPDGRPTVVAFSTPSCAACHTAQWPALEQLQQQLGPQYVRLIGVDAARQPRVAQAFGILTVPSTVVLDATGRVAAVNQGFTATPRLLEQVQTA